MGYVGGCCWPKVVVELLILSVSHREKIGDKPRLSLKPTIPNLIVVCPLLLFRQHLALSKIGYALRRLN